jgi:hypothetical protein
VVVDLLNFSAARLRYISSWLRGAVDSTRLFGSFSMLFASLSPNIV